MRTLFEQANKLAYPFSPALLWQGREILPVYLHAQRNEIGKNSQIDPSDSKSMVNGSDSSSSGAVFLPHLGRSFTHTIESANSAIQFRNGNDLRMSNVS